METIMEAVHLMVNNEIEKALTLLESLLPYANENEKEVAVLESYLASANEEEKYTIAEVYMQWGFLKEATAILTELLRMYPDENDIKVMLADIYIELEEDEKAIDLLNDVDEADPAYIQTLIQLADLYEAQSLFEVAEQKLLTAKQLEPNELIIDFALGELFFST